MTYVSISQCRVWIAAALRWLLGGPFIWAGTLKLLESQIFADRIAAFQLVPNSLINLTALGLPPLEIISGALLILGWQRQVATLSILLMSSVFLVALILASLRGLTVECGCFGDSFGGWGIGWAVVRDLIFLLGSVWLYLREMKPFQTAWTLIWPKKE